MAKESWFCVNYHSILFNYFLVYEKSGIMSMLCSFVFSFVFFFKVRRLLSEASNIAIKNLRISPNHALFIIFIILISIF